MATGDEFVVQCKTCAHYDPQRAESWWDVREARTDFERKHVPCQTAVRLLRGRDDDKVDARMFWYWVHNDEVVCGFYHDLGVTNLLWLANPERHEVDDD